jgi:hypothetical protein
MLFKKFRYCLAVLPIIVSPICCTVHRTATLTFPDGYARAISDSSDLMKSQECLENLLEEMDVIEKGLRRDTLNGKNFLRVFTGATTYRELGIGIYIYKDNTKTVGDKGNYYFLIDWYDDELHTADDEYLIKSTGAAFRLEELTESLLGYNSESQPTEGRYDGISMNVKKYNPKDNFDLRDLYIGETFYIGLAYQNKHTKAIQTLILSLKAKHDTKLSFECAGSGQRAISEQH